MRLLTAIGHQLSATREQLSTTRETGRKNNALFKTRFEDFKTERASLEEKIKTLEAQLTTLTEDRDKLKVQSNNDTAATAQQDAALRKELETIRAEKASLEKQLADERARSALAANSSQSDVVVCHFLSVYVAVLIIRGRLSLHRSATL